MSIGIIMIDNSLCLVTLLKVSFVLHPCGVVKIIEQCEENCHRFNQNRKDSLVPIRLCINFYKTLLFRVVFTRQIELDLYLFSRVWNGLTLMTLILYDLRRMLTVEDDVIYFTYHISGLLNVCSSKDGSLFYSVVCSSGSLFSVMRVVGTASFPSRHVVEVTHIFFGMVTTKSFSSNQSIFLSAWDYLLVFRLYLC